MRWVRVMEIKCFSHIFYIKWCFTGGLLMVSCYRVWSSEVNSHLPENLNWVTCGHGLEEKGWHNHKKIVCFSTQNVGQEDPNISGTSQSHEVLHQLDQQDGFNRQLKMQTCRHAKSFSCKIHREEMRELMAEKSKREISAWQQAGTREEDDVMVAKENGWYWCIHQQVDEGIRGGKAQGTLFT